MEQSYGAKGLDRARLVCCCALALVAGSARVDALSVVYEAEVIGSRGDPEDNFPRGTSVVVSYTLDPAAVDSDPAPDAGVFHDAIVSLTVSFPDVGIFAVAHGGTVQTFDNVVDTGAGTASDQVFVRGEVVGATSLGPEELEVAEVEFISASVPAPNEPRMLTSDALPLTALPEPILYLRTRNEDTGIFIAVSAVGSTESAAPSDSSGDGCTMIEPGLRTNRAGALALITMAVLFLPLRRHTPSRRRTGIYKRKGMYVRLA
jgi:hypothetical protein